MLEGSNWLAYEPSTRQCIVVKVEKEEEFMVQVKKEEEFVVKVEKEEEWRKIKTATGKIFKCNKPNCEYSTEFKRIIIRHMTVHSDERPYKCDKCVKSFKTNEVLKRHLKSHSEETPFQCDKCECAFKTKGHLNKHKTRLGEIHPKAKPIACHLCDYTCKYKWERANHFLLEHTIMESVRCDYPGCKYSTHLEEYLKRHKKHDHGPEKRFKCNKCERTFRKEWHLKSHSIVHKKKKKVTRKHS